MISGLQQRISAALRRGVPQVVRTGRGTCGSAPATRAPLAGGMRRVRCYEVRVTCGGMVTHETLWLGGAR